MSLHFSVLCVFMNTYDHRSLIGGALRIGIMINHGLFLVVVTQALQLYLLRTSVIII